MGALRTLLLALVVASPSLASAAPPTDCVTPRHAAESLFGWLQPESRSLDLAASCLDPEGRSPDELKLVARRLKEIYDGRSLYVEMARISDREDFVDRKSGEARVVVHPKLPTLYVEKQADGMWRWPRPVLDRVDALHLETYSGVAEGFIDSMPRSLRGAVFGVELWQYLALVGLVFVGLLLRKVIQVVVANRIQRLVGRFGQAWASKFVGALDSPGATLVMAGVISVAYPSLHLPIKAALVVQVAVRVLAVISVVWAAYRLVDVFSEGLAHRAAQTDSKLDDQLVPLVRRSMKVATVILGALFVLQNLDVDVGSLLAGLGIGGLAFALAAKDTLANFFGSVMIFADRPFQIGDWVVLDGGTEGIVEEVGFRSTRIRTFYNSLVTVPNSKIADAKVDNYGARRYRRTNVTLGLTYDTTPEQMQAFVEGVRAILRANPHTRKDYYEVHFSGFGAHSLDVMLYFFFEVASWTEELRERHNVYLEVLRLAKNLGVQFAFPTWTVHHEYVAEPGAPRQLQPPLSPEQLAQVVQAHGPGGTLARPGANELAGGWYAGQEPAPAPPARAKSA
ncbi:mechanosensitive ion channel family protein [Vulgatibacter sp.]|uniref:mechanosensitive ion channel family protein n=1 Tax=Vulgatibacter sp. TaxID=1971226 RepID=UPI0035641826